MRPVLAVPILAVVLAIAAPASAAGDVIVQGERLSASPAFAHPSADRTAAGGAALALLRNGFARTTVDAAGSTTLAVRARGTQCAGAPTLRVTVDGKGIASWSVSATTYRVFTTRTALSPGRHQIAVGMVNDYARARRCDRAVRVDWISLKSSLGAAPPTAVANPFAGSRGYVDPTSRAHRAADDLRSSDPAAAAQLDKIAAKPQADWLGDWTPTSTVASTVRKRIATEAGALPVFVLYAIPHRDCGSYSAGGLSSDAAYTAWIDQIAAGIGTSKAVLIVEPDALASLDCLAPQDQLGRERMLSDATARLGTLPGTTVYLDAGNEGWQPVEVMAARLRRAGVAGARGFSLNVSNFYSTSTEQAYGDRLAAALGNSHFVIDTSRNGKGSDGQWCNPAGRALGAAWTSSTGDPANDALLWVKTPGSSDGTCQGGPPAGTFWTDYALGLASRAG